ncbi:predicted P-loop ATPase and inactivated derivatives [Moorella thermoacetica Y72]|uniref:Predicted P-loop ATPase and inactivated derivatives n=2 Tax=Neomoorella thermoacetica TaxID=1525 RepID=A0A0S6UHL3_NEOTH|nr:predicted P-loop ATPase and inactivated derivatives [Moorella thermoacetica Y72]
MYSSIDYTPFLTEITSWLEQNLPGIKWHGDEGQARCPFHDDHNPSFFINRRKGAWRCWAGCGQGGLKELAARLGVEPPASIMRKNEDPVTRQKIVATYDYVDHDGKLVFQVLRYEPKNFRQRRPCPKGGNCGGTNSAGKSICKQDRDGTWWHWSLDGVKRVPYRLPEIIEAVKSGLPIFVVEGEKDADNLAALGVAATTSPQGAGKWPDDPEFNKYFQGADVIILPDNDDPGQQHAQKVARILAKIARKIKIVKLPGLPVKGDVSDFLAAGHSKDELVAMVEQAPFYDPNQAPEDQEQGQFSGWSGTPYCVDENGYTCYRKFLQSGEVELIKLANFVARPVAEVIRDNGVEREITFELQGTLAGGRPLPAVTVPAERFATMNWVSAAWGMAANLEPGTNAKDRLRHAIQCLAKDVKRETIFTHLGWRRLNGSWVYLHAAGAVGADDIAVDVSEASLGRYALPEEAGDLKRAVNWSLKALDVAPPEVTIPLFAIVYLAPLCEPLRIAGIEPAFVTWLAGATGAMKSTLAALFLSHYGCFNGKTLPGSFKDTSNALEKKAFAAKDTLLVVDDFHPVASPNEARKMETAAQALLRAYGDRVGRSRMRADTSLRAGYAPRGLCIITGEDLPAGGESTTARIFAIELKRGDVNVELLSELQNHTGDLARAMRGYIEALAPELDNLLDQLKEAFGVLRDKARREGQHGRIPEAVAWLYLGLNAGLDYAAKVGAISEEDREARLKTGWQVLLELAEQQARRIEEERPVAKFIAALTELLAAGEVKVEPLPAAEAGYSEPQNFLGWKDHDWYYLLPEITYRTVTKFYRDQGSIFPVTARTLWKHLEAEGLIFVAREGNRMQRTVRETIAGKRQRVLKLKANTLDEK